MIEKKLKELLDKHNLSVAQLARHTEVPKTNIQGWLTGSSPNISQAYKVAEYFGITIEELCFGKKPKTTQENFFKEVLVHSGNYKVQIIKIDEE